MKKIETDEQAKKLHEQLDENATFHGLQIVLMVMLTMLIAILAMNFWARFNMRMWMNMSEALGNCTEVYYQCEASQAYFDEVNATTIYYKTKSNLMNSKGHLNIVSAYETYISSAICEDKEFDA